MAENFNSRPVRSPGFSMGARRQVVSDRYWYPLALVVAVAGGGSAFIASAAGLGGGGPLLVGGPMAALASVLYYRSSPGLQRELRASRQRVRRDRDDTKKDERSQ